MPGTVSDPPSVSLSFANNFWGKDDAGVAPLLGRMHDAKTTCDEMKAFYSARTALEDEYAKKLLALARKPLGSCEAGTLRLSLDVVRAEVEAMGKAHANIAGQMKSELDESLAAFAGGMKERRKIVQNGIEKLLKVKNVQNSAVNKSRDRFEQDCLKIKGYLAQGHMVMGQEERKVKAKLEKTQIQLSTTSSEYEATVKTLEDTTGRWNRDWKAACDKFQDIEEERIDFLKSSLWTFANIASTVCVSDDASCEKIRLSLEDCDVEKDICTFIKERGTGQEIPDPPKFIDFCRGDVNDTASEADEETSYTVAQFPRAINPTIRSSSPQPSTFESHHETSELSITQSEPRRSRSPVAQASAGYDMQLQQTPRQRQPTDSSATGRKPVQREVPSFAPAAKPQAPLDPYPQDGMTQFCRTGPPPIVGVASDLSSGSSNMRPSSRDSHSDYSHPTEYSNDSPNEKQLHAVKPVGYAPPMVSDEVQDSPKKRGFFNSPFRRKSKHGNDARPETLSRTTTSQDSTPRAKPQESYSVMNNRNSNVPEPRNARPQEPVAPQTNYQLNVGNNVFDVAPGARRQPHNESSFSDMDPLVQALADLKEVTKQSLPRQSADRFAGVATPAPMDGSGRATPLNNHISALAAAQKGTPPPSYGQPVSRLGAPPPAHTSRSMQETTRRYTAQAQNTYGGSPTKQSSPSRPASRGPSHEADYRNNRAVSPGPSRSPSPFNGPAPRGQPQYQQQRQSYHQDMARPQSRGDHRAPSPQPYHQNDMHPRPRANTGTPHRQPQPMYSNYDGRGSSPTPSYQRGPSQHQHQGYPMQQQSHSRPASSRGDMAMQLAQSPGADSSRPGSRQWGGHDDGNNGYSQAAGPVGRVRTKSFAGPQNMTKDGLPILHYARAQYLYNAQIPEELGFGKGELLAVLRLQDDGWWEAEVVGKNGRGLVPSNYLKVC